MGEAHDFLAALTNTAPADQWGYLWTFQRGGKKQTHWFDLGDGVEQAASLATELGDQTNVYIGAGTASAKGRSIERVSADAVSGIYALWADVDWVDSTTHKKQNYPGDREQAFEVVESIGLTPSIIVDTGHGLHAWWLLDEFWSLDTESQRSEAANLAQRWNTTLGVRAAERGWTIDSTFDLSRVLRVPGTMNLKIPDDPKKVSILRLESGVSYSVRDFNEWAITEAELNRISVPTSRSYKVEEFTMDTARLPPAGKVSALSENHDLFQATLDRRRSDFTDQSASSYDLSLATTASMAGWSDQEIVDLLISQRVTHGDDPKMRADYYRRTLAKAHEVGAKMRADDEIDDVAEDLADAMNDGDDEGARDHRRKLSDAKSDQLGIELTSVLRYPGETPEFAFVLGGAVHIHVGPIDNITNQGKLRNKLLASDAAVSLAKYKGDDWLRHCEHIRMMAIDQDLGREGTELGLLHSAIEEFLLDRRPIDDQRDAAASRHPYLNAEGRTCIFLEPFHSWLQTQRGERDLTRKRVHRLLTQMGAKPTTLSVTTLAGRSGKREAWILPAEFTPGD